MIASFQSLQESVTSDFGTLITTATSVLFAQLCPPSVVPYTHSQLIPSPLFTPDISIAAQLFFPV
jgi:hypothetical protein